MNKAITVALATYLGCVASAADAQTVDWGARPTFKDDGTVVVPSFELPPSVLSSKEAQGMQRMRAAMAGSMPTTIDTDIARNRRTIDTMVAPQLALIQKMYPTAVEESEIAGVPVRIVTPSGGKFDRERVLIHLHGGAFSVCWQSCSLIESIPIAAKGGYKVISVNYRMAPEARHPAGAEDVAKVYAELIKQYRPERVGIFGCSAGGALTAQTAAWLSAHGLPQPGAIGIFGAGGVRFQSGDSAYLAGYIDGSFPPPMKPGTPPIDMTHGYFDGADMDGADVSPALHPEVLAKFPPTLIITGTRAMDMSPAIFTNSQLIKAGVETDMIVGEGLGHCYMMTPTLPEAQDAYEAIIGFFRKHLR